MEKINTLLNKKATIKIPYWIFALAPFAVYLIWVIYRYTQVGVQAATVPVHMVQYVYVWLAGVFIFRLIGGRHFSEKTKKGFLVFSAVVSTLAMVEVVLHIRGFVTTYLEEANSIYISLYVPQEHPRYHIYTTDTCMHRMEKNEYSYACPTNCMGFADKEWTTAKKPKEKRIMALGDSFTEGAGAPYDSTYVNLLDKKLLAAGDSFYFMNAGIIGSDPFDNYINLTERLYIYQPDVVLQSIASSDLTTDIILRGGMERYQKDGRQKYKPAPWWEPVYAFSYTSRLFFASAGYSQLLRKRELQPEEIKTLNAQVIDLFKDYAAFCREKKIRLVILLRPDMDEIAKHKYSYDFSTIFHALKTDSTIQLVDLMPSYCRYLEKKNAKIENYYWEVDRHHNSIGYEMLAQCVFENLSPMFNDTTVIRRK